jgi:o-succinylbenzoate synthase
MRLRFQFRRYRLPFRTAVRTARGPWAEREGVIVRLEDAEEGGSGAVGFGEAAPIPWFGTETVDEVEAGCRSLGEWIEESAFEAVPTKLSCMHHALAGALAECRSEREKRRASGSEDRVPAVSEENHDPTSRPVSLPLLASNSPLHATLGVAALLPAGRLALPLIAPKAEMGFRVFKWKVGVADLADELALLDDVCAELPDGSKLRLDANGAWDRRRAERWLERCADRPVEFVEQPCFADAAEGATAQRRVEDVLLGLAGDYPTPIALDESLIGEGDLERWIGAGWPGVYVVKPSLFANVSSALARLEKAKASVVFSSALETALGAKAALKVAFAWKGEPDFKALKKAEEAAKSAPAMTRDSRAATPEARGVASPLSERAEFRRSRALGFGVWPLFADARFDGPYVAPYLRFEDVERIDCESLWNALS